MTGPEHYREAERLLDVAWTDGALSDTYKARLELRAQVHATLALAAEKRGTLEEQRLSAMLDEKINEAIEVHRENEPHIYADGSTS